MAAASFKAASNTPLPFLRSTRWSTSRERPQPVATGWDSFTRIYTLGGALEVRGDWGKRPTLNLQPRALLNLYQTAHSDSTVDNGDNLANRNWHHLGQHALRPSARPRHWAPAMARNLLLVGLRLMNTRPIPNAGRRATSSASLPSVRKAHAVLEYDQARFRG